MIRRSGALALLVLPLAVATAHAAPVTVNVRVEGVHKTLFEGNVKTAVHTVDGSDGTGAHKCDGTNGGANATPGPTVTGAFDNGAQKADLSWAGSWSNQFEDFAISRVGPDSQTSSEFWNLELNWQDLNVGGCQQEIKARDRVLVAFDAFGKPLLRLTGPKHVVVGRKFHVKVVNGRDGSPVKHAKVGGKKTNSKGLATLRAKQTGTRRLKARRAGSIRSNELDVHARDH